MFYRWCRVAHNWLGLLLVVQILLWFISGLVMAIMPIDEVRGTHLTRSISTNWQAVQVSPAEVLAQQQHYDQVHFSHAFVDGEWVPVYLLHTEQQIVGYSALSGLPLTVLNAAEAAAAAQTQYQGTGTVAAVELLYQLPIEARNLAVPAWQVRFADADDTMLYLDATTGVVQRVRTNQWRLFDFLWMLHIMDYDQRSDFNNPLLILMSALASLFTVTGLILLWRRFGPRNRRLAR